MKKFKIAMLLCLLGIGTNVYAEETKILLTPSYCTDTIKTLDFEGAKFKYVTATLKQNLHLRVIEPGKPAQWSAIPLDIKNVYKSLDPDDIPILVFLLTQNGVSPEIKGVIQETLKLFGKDSIICMDSILNLKTTKNPQIIQQVKQEVLKSLNRK